MNSLVPILASLPVLLARSNQTGWFKFVPLVIVVAIWVFGMLITTAKRAAKKREVANVSRRIARSPQRPSPPAVGKRTAERQTPVNKALLISSPSYRSPAKAQVPPPFKGQAAAPASIAVPPATIAARKPTAVAAGPVARPAAIVRSWLKPEIIRRNYAITELFDPPPALRRN